ncbi:hypothetical protein GCM10009647_073930 [Streptomyces sanglieri]
MGRRLALLIATYDYQDTGLRQLTAPAHDAEAFADVLRDPDIAGFEVTTLINKPLQQVGEAIGDLYRDRRRDDLTLLYFTGHGLKDEDGRLCLAMANTRRDSLLFTSLPGRAGRPGHDRLRVPAAGTDPRLLLQRRLPGRAHCEGRHRGARAGAVPGPGPNRADRVRRHSVLLRGQSTAR